MIWFLVVGILISFANPILGAVILFPWAVVWVAKRLSGGTDGSEEG